mmetsp:Transcript_6693/g.8458  ORF Transcript_6693/g.8458 Transcript_6693/m.8458 type:complete len:816 (+) Transcript_6693:12-2459(+)
MSIVVSSFIKKQNTLNNNKSLSLHILQCRHESSKSGIPKNALPLGHPIPLDEHACSVSLPSWHSVVGYEEGFPEVTEKLACGYPRFVYHPYIITLMDVALEMDAKLQQQDDNATESSGKSDLVQSSEERGESEWDCIVLPSKDSALRCHDFLVRASMGTTSRLTDSCRSLVAGSSAIQLFADDNALNDYNISVINEERQPSCYNSKSPIRVLDLEVADVHAVIFPAQTSFAIEAKSYWQHTGEVLSSRRAESALVQLGMCQDNIQHKLRRVTPSFHKKADDDSNFSEGDWEICPFTNQRHLALFPSVILYPSEIQPSDAHDQDEMSKTNDAISQRGEQLHTLNPFEGIKQRIASIVGTPSSSVFLTSSGMASIYAALRSARRREILSSRSPGGGSSVVFGFPYLDTLKMCSRPELVPDGVAFFGHGNEQDLNNLEKMLKDRKNDNNVAISVLITEFPSNPLLKCPDLHKLRSLADEYDFALVVDDTIGNFANVDLIQSGLADAICTSLTKLFNGRGDAMAGSVVINPHTKIGQWMQSDMEKNHYNHEGLWPGDAFAINANSVDFLFRSSKINETSEALADWLHERDEVAALYYPKYTCPEGYNAVLNKNNVGGEHKPGYGGLLSIVLANHICQRTFYDKLDLSKGPSLGTNFSLVCPYTLLAHYHELDFALSYDVQPNLLRFAIGLEDLDVLKSKILDAFQESKLHPKLPDKSKDLNKMSSRSFCSLSFQKENEKNSTWASTLHRNKPQHIRYGLLGHMNRYDAHCNKLTRRFISSSSRDDSCVSLNDLGCLGSRGKQLIKQNARTLSRKITLLI